jgi:hypothetical protein
MTELSDLWWVLVPVLIGTAVRYAPVVERALDLQFLKWLYKQDPKNARYIACVLERRRSEGPVIALPKRVRHRQEQIERTQRP